VLKPRAVDHLEGLPHALQVAAEEVRAVRLLRARRVVSAAVALRHRVPLLFHRRQVVQRVAVPGVVLGVPVPEPVGEDLVDDRVLCPRRRCEAGCVGGLRVAPVADAGRGRACAAVEGGRVVGVIGRARPVLDDEAVPVDVRRGVGIVACQKSQVSLASAGSKHETPLATRVIGRSVSAPALTL